MANRRPEIRRRIFTRVIGLALIGSLLVLISLPLTHFVFDRFSTQHGNPLATVEMRMFLWKSALRTFLGHPVFGSGLATETIWSQILPGMRFDPMFVHTQGLSAHNSVLAYLANTGFVGSAILFVFLWRTLAMGRSIVAHVIDDERAMWRLGMLSIVFVIVTRYLYEGHLFYSVGGMSTTTFIAFMMCLKEGRSGPETSVAHRASS